MKKLNAFLLALAVSAVGINAQAQAPVQDSQFFNHWSVGVGVGVINGLDIQAATTITPHLQARVVYSNLPIVAKLFDPVVKNATENKVSINPLSVNVENVGITINQLTPPVTVDKIAVNGNFTYSSLSLLADFFPSKSSSFHLTGGVLFFMNPQIIDVSAELLDNAGNNVIPLEDRASTKIYGITTDPEGKLHASVALGANRVQPYLGIGFGHPVALNSIVNVNLDLGVAYIGGAHLNVKSYNLQDPANPVDVELNSGWLNDPAQADIKNALGEDAAKITDILDKVNTFPVVPIVRFSIMIRLF